MLNMIGTYIEFLSETENVKVKKELREFTLTHKQEAMFELKSADYFKEFSVTPFKNETLDKLKNAFNRLIDAIEEEKVNKLYDVVTTTELLDYTFGNVFQSKFSLMTIPEIDINLTEEQKNSLKTSEREFLLNTYSGLSKTVKTAILVELIDRAQILACVIEALFYYVRNEDKKSYYNGMAVDEILDEYEDVIEKASKDVNFSYEGPSDSEDRMSPITPESKKAYWLCEKDLKKFVIFGTISVEDLYSEENVGGTKGLKLSIADQESEKDFNFFNLTELSDRIKLFIKKNDKKL